MFFVLFFLSVAGQEDPYKAEFGANIGMNIYAGDVNAIADLNLFSKNMANLQPDLGLTFRYRFNKRLALKFGYDYSKVGGMYHYRDGNNAFQVKLNNPLHLVDLVGEFNFFDLENNPYKRFSKKYSPFIFAGAGSVWMPQYQNSPNQNVAFLASFGFGVKAKIAERINLNLQFANKWLLGDGLEGKSQFDNPFPPTHLNGMNNDLLSGISIGITYDFWMKNCDCYQPEQPQKIKTPKIKKRDNKRKR